MAIAFVNRVATTSGTNVSSRNVTANITSGNLVVVTIQCQGATVSSVTDTIGNTYAKTAKSPFTNNNGTNRQSIWWTVSSGTNASNVITATLGGTYNYTTMAALQFSPTSSWGTPTIADQTGTSGSGTAIATASITIANPSVVVAIAIGVTGTLVAGAGYTATSEDSNVVIWDEYHIVSTSEAATMTQAGSGEWGIIGAAFTEPGGGGGGTNWAPMLARTWNRLIQVP